MCKRRKDVALKRYFSDNARFADLLNGMWFQGRQIVQTSDLSEVDTQAGILYRDLARKTAFGVNFAVVGIENQSQVHYLMPLRVMNYDVAEYKRQVDAVSRSRKQAGYKGVSSDEFLSGFGKEDRLHPCVTIVLFYGEEWDGGTDLYGLLDFTDIPEEIQRLVGNYPMNLLQIRKLEQTDGYRTDLQQVFDFIRYSTDKKRLRELVISNPVYRSLAEDAYDVAVEFTGAKELIEVKKAFEKGGEVDMCKALTEMLQDERMEGRKEGIHKVNIEKIQKMIRKGCTKEFILDLDYTEDEYTEAEADFLQLG